MQDTDGVMVGGWHESRDVGEMVEVENRQTGQIGIGRIVGLATQKDYEHYHKCCCEDIPSDWTYFFYFVMD